MFSDDKKDVISDVNNSPALSDAEVGDVEKSDAYTVDEFGDSEIYIDPIAEAKVLRKCDMYLMPVLTIAFLSAYLDRNNIGNAATAGMKTDLKMTEQTFANAVLFFYVTYVPFQSLGALLVKKLRASRLMPLFMLGWSITCLGTGFMKTTPQFYASRLLIGLFESGMYPALTITLTTFYTPREQGLRFSYLYLSVGLSGAFGGLFAFALLKLDGHAGIAGWRWLYIVEGCLTIGVALLLWAWMPDNFESAKFLNEDDKKLMRLRNEKHDRYMRLNETFDKKEMIRAFKDPKIWLTALVQFLGDIMSFGTSTFLPAIIKNFGFDTTLTQVLTIPVFSWGVAFFIAISYWSDRIQKRAIFMVPAALSLMIGYILLCTLPFSNYGVLYFALFFITPGIYIMLGLNSVWALNSHAGYYKRATSVGIFNTCGNSAGLVFAQVYKEKDHLGRSFKGNITSAVISAFCALVIVVMYWNLRRQNIARDALTPEERQRWIDDGKTGDAHPDFRFIL